MSAPLLFVCDSIAWRVDRVVEAVDRLLSAVQGRGAEAMVLGYRERDDLALVGVDGLDPSCAGELIAAAQLPGLRRLEVPGGAEAAVAARDRGLASCDRTASVSRPGHAARTLRAALGLTEDLRAARRVSARFPLRYRATEGESQPSTTRDLAAGGLFVETERLLPDVGVRVSFELELPDEPEPLTGQLIVVRHAPGGFGARLSLLDEEHERLVRAMSRRGPSPA